MLFAYYYLIILPKYPK